jgi:hypothetical protein
MYTPSTVPRGVHNTFVVLFFYIYIKVLEDTRKSNSYLLCITILNIATNCSLPLHHSIMIVLYALFKI